MPDDSYVITYNGNGALGRMDDKKFTSSSAAFRLDEMRYLYDGMKFTGWNTMPDGSGVWYSDERLLNKGEFKDLTLFAQWVPVSSYKPYLQLDYIQSNGPHDPSGGSTDATLRAYILLTPDTGNHFRVKTRFSFPDTEGYGTYGMGTAAVSNYKFIIEPYRVTAVSGGGGYYETYSAVPGDIIDGDWSLSPAGYINLKSVKNGTLVEDRFGTRRDLATDKSGIALFGYWSGGRGNSGAGNARIYYFKYWKDDESLMYDMIPVMLTDNIDAAHSGDGSAHSAGELGMWDLVAGKFYGNMNSSGYFSNDDLILVEYNAGTGTGTMKMQAFKSDTDAHALSPVGFTNGSRRFVGWNTKADGTGTWFSDGYEARDWNRRGVLRYNLYAIWEGDTLGSYTVADGLSMEYFSPRCWITTDQKAYFTLGHPFSAAANMTVDLMTTAVGPLSSYANYEYKWYFGYRESGTNSCFGAAWVRGYPGTAGRNFWIGVRNNGSSPFNGQITDAEVLGRLLRFDIVNGERTDIYRDGGATVWKTVASASGSSGQTFKAAGDVPVGVFFDTVQDDGSHTMNPGFVGRIYGTRYRDSSYVQFLIPCVLDKKISSYEAGTLASDNKTHQAGEVGMWDIVGNRFYPNMNIQGSFSTELSE